MDPAVEQEKMKPVRYILKENVYGFVFIGEDIYSDVFPS
jgi:hypothetical protein